jgi:F-type H+-transporting ATPase subunit b
MQSPIGIVFILDGGLLNPSTGLIFWTVLTFLILLVLLRAVAWKPILQALKDREDNIAKSINRAETARNEAENILAQNKELLAKAEQESGKILMEGKAAAERLRSETVSKAQEEAKKVLENAKAEITRQKDIALSELRNEVADLAVKAAEKILSANIDAAKQKDLVDDVIKNVRKN